MNFNPLSILSEMPYINLPVGLLNWAFGLLLAIGLMFWIARMIKDEGEVKVTAPWLMPLCLILIPLSLIVVIQAGLTPKPLPNLPYSATAPSLLPLWAIPWMLAAYYLRNRQALIVILLSALGSALWVTHDPFTLLFVILTALFFLSLVKGVVGSNIHPRLRQPFNSAILTSLIAIPALISLSLFIIPGSLAERLDFALSDNWYTVLFRVIEILLAGVVIQLLSAKTNQAEDGSEYPASDTSVTGNKLLQFSILGFLIVALLTGTWLVSAHVAKKNLELQMKGIASTIKAEYSSMFSTGKNLVSSLANEYRLESDEQALQEQLRLDMERYPFFHRLEIVDRQGTILAAYPADEITDTAAVQKVLLKTDAGLPVVALMDGTRLYTSAVIGDESGRTLIGSLELAGAISKKLDVTSDPSVLPRESYFIRFDNGSELPKAGATAGLGESQFEQSDGFFQGLTPNGAKQYGYQGSLPDSLGRFQVLVPKSVVQGTALKLAWPLLAASLLLGILAIVLIQQFRGKFSAVSTKVHTSPDDTAAISNHSLAWTGLQKTDWFKQDLLDPLVKKSMGQILEAALGEHGLAARAVFFPIDQVEKAAQKFNSTGAGLFPDQFSHLDEQVFHLMRSKDIAIVRDAKMDKQLSSIGDLPHPRAIIAAAVRSPEQYFGAIWVAFGEERDFQSNEIARIRALADESTIIMSYASLIASDAVEHKRFDSILNSIPNPLLILDAAGKVIYANKLATDIPGLLSTANDAGQVLIAKNVIEFLANLKEATENSTDIQLANGRNYKLALTPFAGRSGELGRIVFFQDVTSVEEQKQAKTDFIATVSHAIQNPLNMMKGYASMVPMVGEINEQQRGFLEKIGRGFEEMSKLVDNLLELSTLEGSNVMSLAEIDLCQVIGRVIDSHKLEAAQKKIRVEFEHSKQKDSVVIYGDPAMIEQALVNLLENAIRYTKVGGNVSIKLVPESEFARIEVQDSGIGISPIDLPHIFEWNYPHANEQNGQRGSGWGLPIVRSIIDRHHGNVEAQSQLGVGTLIRIKLPVAISK